MENVQSYISDAIKLQRDFKNLYTSGGLIAVSEEGIHITTELMEEISGLYATVQYKSFIAENPEHKSEAYIYIEDTYVFAILTEKELERFKKGAA